MKKHLEQRQNEVKEIFEIRTGIHTGPVVAGKVVVKKNAYDIRGNTVNIASRMESSGEAGKVNISGAAYNLFKNKFNCIHTGKKMQRILERLICILFKNNLQNCRGLKRQRQLLIELS